MKNYKVSIIGAGNVGALTAMRLVEANLCDVALIDVVDGLAKGKAEDIMDSASVLSFDYSISGTTDFGAIEDSSVVVIAAGFARKPGMTREQLLSKNCEVLKDVSKKISQYAPNSIIVNITNPLDAMTYIAYKYSGFKPNKIVGMAGLLDSSRMNLLTARLLKKSVKKINSVVLGTHGETMVPLTSQSSVGDISFDKLLAQEQLKGLIENTKNRGAEIVSYLKTGSAFFAPSACAAKMVEIILKDKKETITASCFLNGEYDISGIYLGVPAILGKNGVEKIIELKLTKEESRALHKAAEAVKDSIQNLQLTT